MGGIGAGDLAARLQAAKQRHLQGDLAAARQGYEAILRDDARHFDALHLSGVLALQTGRATEAVALLRAALAVDPAAAAAQCNCGNALRQLGQPQQALACFDAAIAVDAGFALAHYNRGLALQDLGQHAAAAESYAAAVALQPGDAEALSNWGAALRLAGQPEAALARIDQALALQPRLLAAHASRAATLEALGQAEAALVAYGQALALQPGDAALHLARAALLHRLGRLEAALSDYDAAIAAAPGHAEALSHRGVALQQLQRPSQALASFEAALAAAPGHAGALYNRALLLQAQGAHQPAVEGFAALLRQRPDDAEALCQRATSLLALGQEDAAMADLQRAMQASPPDGTAWRLAAGLCLRRQHYRQAIAFSTEAIARDGQDAAALALRGIAHGELGETAPAIDSFRAALAIDPGDADSQFDLAEVLAASGDLPAAAAATGAGLRLRTIGLRDGERIAALCAGLVAANRLPAIYPDEAAVETSRAGVAAALAALEQGLQELRDWDAQTDAVFRETAFRTSFFYLAYQQRDDRDLLQALSRCLTRMLRAEQAMPLPRRQGPVRIGIASELLYDHNGARWAYDWLAQLPPGYAFFTYALHGRRDAVLDRFAALGTHRRLECRAGSYREAVAAIRADALDVLMLPDVGMTPSSRVLSQHRMAPLQFTAWGHPVTSGSAAMDCYLSSDLMEPEDAEAHYSESLVRLPNLALFLQPPSPRQVAPPPFALPEGRVLFGCLQSLFKYAPRHDALLAQVAAQLPAALFLFLEGDPSAMTAALRLRLQRAFAAAGLDADRHILFLPRVSAADYAGLLRRIDVMVDSIGWSGGNSTLEAIAAGLPLVTLPGAFMRGRHSYAMLRMMGLADMAAVSEQDFVARLVALGRDADRRAHDRARLQAAAPRLYRDHAFIAALDGFLKQRTGQG